ncbi:serine/threonine protein kinase [Mortierella sp. AD094]|nr:serine/threonine protein kinase [Mortierella sp. AD094]
MPNHLKSPAGSNSTVSLNAADHEQLLPLDASNIQHFTPELSTPNISNIQTYINHHPTDMQPSQLLAAKLESPISSIATAQLPISSPPQSSDAPGSLGNSKWPQISDTNASPARVGNDYLNAVELPQAEDRLSVQPGKDSAPVSSSLANPVKRKLPISPLALSSAIPDEDNTVATPGPSDAPKQHNLNTPNLFNENAPPQNVQSIEPQAMGAGRRSRAVISEMTPVEIDKVLEDAATILVVARHEIGGSASSSDVGSPDHSGADHKSTSQARQISHHNLTTHAYFHGLNLSRTSSDATEVIVSRPASVDTSRHNSDDEDDGHYQDPVPTQRRQYATSVKPFPLQPQPQGPLGVVKPDESIQQLSNELERQKIGSLAAPSTPGPSFAYTAVEDTNVTVKTPILRPASPNRHHSITASLRRKDKEIDPSKSSHRKAGKETSHGIFHDLKRFFNVGHSTQVSPSATSVSPSSSEPHASSTLKSKKSFSGSGFGGSHGSEPSGGQHGNAIETDLRKKYGKLGKVLGRGAGGTVRILSRSSDHKVFAIKQFQKRRPDESERSYVKKVTSEYCLGSTFHHPNIIETLDIVKESGSYYEVMEFAKYELFSAVMSGLMGREEIACCFKGIIDGVAYLHDLGVAHRDLKLDNCVMNERGIVKIIDFGCSMVFQPPFDKKIQMAKGVSGSDPYIAPEVFTTEQHDPRLADIWSMGIIFLCMALRRFPWRIPRFDQDQSFQAFAMPDGKQRLLKLMPRESRPIMSKILELDPSKRVLIGEVLEDPWIKSLDHCTTEYMSPNHAHHLGDDGTVAPNPHEGVSALPPSNHGSESGRSQDITMPTANTPTTSNAY